MNAYTGSGDGLETAVDGATFSVPCHIVKSLQLI